MRSRLFAVVVAVFTLLGSTAAPRAARAQAQAGPAAAAGGSATGAPGDEDKRKGDEAMLALRYADALAYYTRAYEANENPALEYNMGRAYEALGDFPAALESLEKFKAEASPELRARVPKLDELMSDIAKRVATLVVSSNEPDAEIRVGERVVGKTEPKPKVLRLAAPPGGTATKLSVSKEGFHTVNKDVTLTGGRIETVEIRLVSKHTSGVLRITSVPGAQVSIDGAVVGNVPAEQALSAGPHRISLTRAGYEPAQTNVIVAAGQEKDLDVPMNEKSTLTGKWWFWTAIGAVVVAGGITTYIALTTEKDPDSGSIQPGRVKAQGFAIPF